MLPKLLEWIRFHFPKYDRNAATMLTGDLEGLDSNALYWETVFGSLLQGRIDVVRALLRLHANGNSVTFRLVDETLKTMPVYNVRSKIKNKNIELNHHNYRFMQVCLLMNSIY